MGLAAILVASAITAAPQPAERTSPPQYVAVGDLARAPEIYDGQRIRTSGVLVMDEGGAALYPDFASADASMLARGIWTAGAFYSERSLAAMREIDHQAVVVEGDFSARQSGHGGVFGAALRNVDDVAIDKSVLRPPPTATMMTLILLLIPIMFAFSYWAVLQAPNLVRRR